MINIIKRYTTPEGEPAVEFEHKTPWDEAWLGRSLTEGKNDADLAAEITYENNRLDREYFGVEFTDDPPKTGSLGDRMQSEFEACNRFVPAISTEWDKFWASGVRPDTSKSIDGIPVFNDGYLDIPNAKVIRDRINASTAPLVDKGFQPPSGSPLHRRVQATGASMNLFFTKYREGNVITEIAFLSAAIEVPATHATLNVEFAVYAPSGVDITEHSATPEEGQYLIPSGTQFKVVRVFQRNSIGISRIVLREVG